MRKNIHWMQSIFRFDRNVPVFVRLQDGRVVDHSTMDLYGGVPTPYDEIAASIPSFWQLIEYYQQGWLLDQHSDAGIYPDDHRVAMQSIISAIRQSISEIEQLFKTDDGK